MSTGQAFSSCRGVPSIETPRLRLRGHTPADFTYFFSLWSDPEVTRYIGGSPLSRHDAWLRFLRYFGHWSVLGFGSWAIEEFETGQLIGEVGIYDYKRELQTPLGSSKEVGWALSPCKQGQGYATEAVRGMLGWASAHLAPVDLACIVHPEHHASIRVAIKCGFEERITSTYRGAPVVIFQLAL